MATLQTGISSTDTTIALDSVAGFDATGFALIELEMMDIGSVDTEAITLAVTRGYACTTRQAFDAGRVVRFVSLADGPATAHRIRQNALALLEQVLADALAAYNAAMKSLQAEANFLDNLGKQIAKAEALLAESAKGDALVANSLGGPGSISAKTRQLAKDLAFLLGRYKTHEQIFIERTAIAAGALAVASAALAARNEALAALDCATLPMTTASINEVLDGMEEVFTSSPDDFVTEPSFDDIIQNGLALQNLDELPVPKVLKGAPWNRPVSATMYVTIASNGAWDGADSAYYLIRKTNTDPPFGTAEWEAEQPVADVTLHMELIYNLIDDKWFFMLNYAGTSGNPQEAFAVVVAPFSLDFGGLWYAQAYGGPAVYFQITVREA